MANIYKNQGRRGGVVPGGAQKPQEATEREEVVVPTPETEKPVGRKEEPVETDLLADLDVEKSASKTFSFYLTIKNVQKLERIAKKKGVSSSKLLDHIISKL